ncbi:MAG: SRPBCC family protein [Actinobacteria bacterium]|nr:SRPBCC family protein [Actinomycetota bacterium]MCL6095249.1 SRPBCC family protein [Actinomycetota bacterium]
MQLDNSFVVPIPVEQAWELLTDIPLIAPCMPGATLLSASGDRYEGKVKVKVGPIVAEYSGTASFLERDEHLHKASLRADGRETRGQGSANATITAMLTEVENGTKVDLTTDLAITGRVAQFGRGVLSEVTAKLLDQFATCLQTKLIGSPSTEGADGHSSTDSEATSSTPSIGGTEATKIRDDNVNQSATQSSKTNEYGNVSYLKQEAEPVDILAIAGPSLRKRLIPAVMAIAGIIAALVAWKRLSGLRHLINKKH